MKKSLKARSLKSFSSKINDFYIISDSIFISINAFDNYDWMIAIIMIMMKVLLLLMVMSIALSRLESKRKRYRKADRSKRYLKKRTSLPDIEVHDHVVAKHCGSVDCKMQ